MEFQEIKELLAVVDSTDIVELEIENEGFKIRIRKKEAQAATAKKQVTQDYAGPSGEPLVVNKENLLEVKAPMVGTFYRASAPDAQPYVQVGDEVQEGQVLFIIEAMKMMNEIVAEFQGVIKEFLVENGTSVEYGESLLIMEPID